MSAAVPVAAPWDDDADSADVAETDGRRLRRTRNRAAAVDALLALYRAGHLDPSAAEIATKAGLSPRSLFRYFDDTDDLVRTAIDRQSASLQEVLQRRVDPLADLSARIADFVAIRLQVLDTIGGVGRVARLRAPFHAEIARRLGELRLHLRRQIERAFAPELRAIPAASRGAVVAAIDVLCSFESSELLTATDDDRATVLTTAIHRLLGVG